MSRSATVGQARIILVLVFLGIFAVTTPVHSRGRVQHGVDSVASTGAGGLKITIIALSPAIPKAKSTVKIRGIVTNVSAAPVALVSVQMRLSPTRLTGRSEIESVLSGNTTREGIPVGGSSQSLTPSLAVGASVEFTLRAKVADLTLPTPGVYVLGAEATGDSGSGVMRQDLERTFLPWWTKAAANPLGLVLLWPITGPPDRDADGVFLTESLAVQMSPAGRLSSLLHAGQGSQGSFTWVLDPQVVSAAASMAAGYQVRGDSGAKEVVPGTRSGEVGQWLSEVTGAVNDPHALVSASLYANPDVDAARGAKALGNLLSQRSAVNLQTAGILGRGVASQLVLAPGGNVDAATAQTLADADVGALVMADWAMPPTLPSNHTSSDTAIISSEAARLPTLLMDSGMSSALAMPATTDSEVVLLRQRLLAETLVVALEQPNLNRVIAAAPDPQWTPSQSGAEAVLAVAARSPWLAPASISHAFTSATDTVERIHAPRSSEEIAAQISPTRALNARENQKDVTTYRRIVADPDDIPAVFQQAPARELASYFRAQPAQGTALSNIVTEQIVASIESVKVVSSGSITVSGESGTIPITVSNDGTAQVKVGLELRSTPPMLFSAEEIPPFRISPGKRTSIEVRARVSSSTNIPVEIQLVTADGHPIGEPSILIVRSAAYAKAARIIVMGSLALLVLTVLIHGLRRARKARLVQSEVQS